MDWWGYLLVALVVLFVVRWVMVGRALREQQPSTQAIAEAMPHVLEMRMLLDGIVERPGLSLEERDDALSELQGISDTLIALMRRNVSDSALVYLRHFLDFAELVYDFYRHAPFDLRDPADAEVWQQLRHQQQVLEAKGEAIIARNPTPSPLRMIVFGVPKVRSVD